MARDFVGYLLLPSGLIYQLLVSGYQFTNEANLDKSLFRLFNVM